MEIRRSEQDRTGDYGREHTGYCATESTHDFFARRELTSRCTTLRIQDQAVVNRLFNMTANVLMRKVGDAVRQNTELVGGRRFPTITNYLGAELLNTGDIGLWANSTDDYHFWDSKPDTFDSLSNMPPWDQAIFGSFASHLTEPYATYSVEVKDVTAEMIELGDRKGKAAVITKLVTQNVAAIPSLHIDIVKDIRISGITTHDNNQALVLDISNAGTANEVIHRGLQWEGQTHLCEVFDVRSLDRCGYCQEYGHHADICTRIPRCGNCAGRHSTKACRSSFIKCASCAEPHRARSADYQGKKARRVDKLNARFPTEDCSAAGAVPSKEPQAVFRTANSSETDPSAPQIEQSDTMKEGLSKSSSIPAQSTFSFALTPSAQQLQDKFPVTEADLQSGLSNLREGTCSKP